MGRMGQMIGVMWLAVGAALAGPQMECVGPAHDFGSVSRTSVVSHVFVIANSGDAPLKIDWTRVCCGATADWTTNVVAAGTSTTLRVTLAMAGKIGRVERAIYVMSNDPVRPIFRLTLMAEP